MNSSSKADEKARIRDKYRDSSSEGIEVIPAIGEIDFYSDVRSKRVAVYARVSTDDSRQTSSFELQQNHYEDVVRRHLGWELVEIYADEGISGTSLKNRDAFMRMINDCEAGLIDLIVTKSVSRLPAMYMTVLAMCGNWQRLSRLSAFSSKPRTSIRSTTIAK